MKSKVKLGVNVDHIATLREVRGGTTEYPNLLHHVKLAIKGGADQITIHLREDRRHIKDKDLEILALESKVPMNLEMAAIEEMVNIALKMKPDFVCFVPEKREELTTEGGLDVIRLESKLKLYISQLHEVGIPVTLFIEPSLKQVRASKRVGAHAVEFHTGKWVLDKGLQKKREWTRLTISAKEAYSLELEVHAGHGLDWQHTEKILELPYLEEVNIGHSIVCYALEMGLKKSVKKFKQILLRRSQ